MKQNINNYEKITSFSQNNLFMKCPRTWYMKYILKIPGEEDLKYAHRGQVLHKSLEAFYNNEIKLLPELENYFDELWFKKYKLDKTSLKNNKEETWNMVLRGIYLGIKPTTNELKIYYHNDVVAYLDVYDSKNKIAGDYKSSTRSKENEKEYSMQGKFYAWLVYRKFGYILDKFYVYYLKYDNERKELVIKPTMQDIENAKNWHYKIKERMKYFIDNPDKLPDFNKNNFFCPYKHLWDIDKKDPSNKLYVNIDYYANYFYIKGNLDENLLNIIYDEFSYEKKDAYYIKKKYPNISTTVRLFSLKLKRLPSGLYKKFLELLTEYANNNNKYLIFNLNDKRYFNKKNINMPNALLSGKILRDYQENGKQYFINKNNYCILEVATGGGKTLIATELIRCLAVKTLFVINKKELLHQTKKAFEEDLGIEIGIIGDGQKKIRDVNVATIQTLTKNIKEYSEFLSDVRFLIIDECHGSASNSYALLSHYMPNTEYRLGLSATAYRTDKTDLKMNGIVGFKGMEIKSENLINEGYLMKPEVNFIKYTIPKEKIKLMEQESKKGLINEELEYMSCYPIFIQNNDERNNIIKDIVKEHEGKNILILVKLIEHGNILEKLIEGSFYLHGTTKKKERKQIFDNFAKGKQKILISTISIFSEGVDIPGLEMVINASANKADIKTIQMLGRVLRKKDGKDKALYYDFIDNFSFFRPACVARIKAFKREGHKVNIIEKWKKD